MKKRKELDALLMNGKKSRPKRSKDGHELLQNMDSDSNSSDLEEFIMQPRKQTIVRRKIALCSICLRLLVFILVVTCIAATAGVVWMNIQLKNDLDELRQKMTDVESALSKSQGSSLDESQEEQLKMIPSLVTNIGKLNESLISINKSLETLKGDIPKTITTKITPIDTKYSTIVAETKESLTNLENKLEKLEPSVDALKTDVASLKEQSSHEPTQTPSKVTSPTGTETEPPSDSSAALLSVQKSLQTLNDSINGLNQTVIDLAAEVNKQHGGSASTGDSTELLQILQQNVTYLMQVVKKELSTDDDSTEAPSGTSNGGGTLPPAFNMTAWQDQLESRLGVLEIEFKQFNPSDLNNNLLNNDTARGIQTILENTYKVFQAEINDQIKTWDSNQTELANRVSEENLLLTNLTIRVDHLEFQFQNASFDKMSEGSPAKDGDTVHHTEPPNGSPQNPVDPGKTPTPIEKVPTVAPNKTPIIPSTTNNGITKPPTEPSQEATPTPVAAMTTKPGDGTSIEGVTDLENLKNTHPSSTGNMLMASRSVASLTDVTELTGVEKRVSTNIGTTFITTEHETTTKQKLTTTPPPPPPNLNIPGIRSGTALQKHFHNWDSSHDEKLNYWEFTQLRAFHGHPPTEAEFLAHDKDNDGSLNMDEMKVALGFTRR